MINSNLNQFQTKVWTYLSSFESSFSSNGLKFASSHFLIKSSIDPFVTHNKCFNKLAWRAGIKYGHSVDSKEEEKNQEMIFFEVCLTLNCLKFQWTWTIC